jgi:hypothetical protein
MTKVFVKAAPKRGFYRAGQFWPNGGREAEVDDKTLERLKAEPRLSVTIVEKSLEDHTVDELKQLAEKRNVNLDGAKKKADIIARLNAPTEPAKQPTAGPATDSSKDPAAGDTAESDGTSNEDATE